MADLPTKCCISIAEASNLTNMMRKEAFILREAMGHFQRVSLVADFDTAFKVLNPYLDRKPDQQELTCLRLLHELAPKDVLGLAIESLIEISQSHVADPKARTTAATILNDLYGEKQLIDEVKLTDKLTINMN